MDFCKWISHEGGYKCEVCGFDKAKHPDTIRRCHQPPSLLTKVGNFIPALTHHVNTGMKKCTQEEIEQRLAICKECPLFVAGSCSHNSCGCSINDKQTFFNKLYWADQKCPLDKWLPISPSG